MAQKLFAVLAALILALGCASALGEGTEYVSYTHPDQDYSLEYPADCIVLDSSSISEVINGTGEIEGLNIDLSSLAAQIEASNMVMFIDPVTSNNLNIVEEEVGMSLSAELIQTLLLPAVREQLTGMLGDCEFTDEGSIAQYGAHEYVRLSAQYTLGGSLITAHQFYTASGTKFYTFSFTGSLSEDVIAHILSTFAAAAE